MSPVLFIILGGPGPVAAGRKISTPKSEAMVLQQKRVFWPLQVDGEVLPPVESSRLTLTLTLTLREGERLRRSLDKRHCSFLLRRCSRHVRPGGGSEADPGHGGETMSHGWPGSASENSSKSWRKRGVWA